MWTWDDDKRKANRIKHGVDFSGIEAFDWANATHAHDDRRDYGETRFVSVGYIGARLHLVTWTQRGDRIRIINLRKANDREQKAYHSVPPAHR